MSVGWRVGALSEGKKGVREKRSREKKLRRKEPKLTVLRLDREPRGRGRESSEIGHNDWHA